MEHTDLLDTHLDLLDRDITSKNFVFLRDVLKTSKCLLGYELTTNGTSDEDSKFLPVLVRYV